MKHRNLLLAGLVIVVMFSGCVSLATARRRQEKSFKVGMSAGKLQGYAHGLSNGLNRCVEKQRDKYREALETLKHQWKNRRRRQ